VRADVWQVHSENLVRRKGNRLRCEEDLLVAVGCRLGSEDENHHSVAFGDSHLAISEQSRILNASAFQNTGCPESPCPPPISIRSTSHRILTSSNIKSNSGRETVITDFRKENQGLRPDLINSDRLRNPLVTIDGETGTKIFRQLFLAERMGTKKDPSGVDEHTRGRCLWAVSDQNLVAEVQNRGSFMQ
jgi:hypothetical protein